ncbi:hypothetical protein CRV00_11265 [Malaciobacter molluscorum]|uniref:tetratricopeptide repeat protein n=1 Tax=Malaciobacter molluscorum TaxID=1032072 RepID=UPI00100B3820|nr:tetratricopeptide repeat protein [Malaciobacter molluscorum]RXJ93354.1 hypothetical protein CRV00_11265 [Malaciobacter molluscorum]
MNRVKIVINILIIVIISLNFIACDDNKSSNNIKSEKKVKLPKPEWDNRLANVEPNTGKWYQLADNDEKAASNIGVIYSDKIKDYKKAIEWYLYSDSIKTNTQNLVNMGITFKDIKDYDNAIKYYKKAYENNSNEAANGLGFLFETILHEYKKAEVWYKKGIERGELGAVKNIGLLYHENLKDDLKASANYITLIDKRYSKEEVLNLLKNKWKIPKETIKKGYELQLNSDEFPIKYKGKLDLDE